MIGRMSASCFTIELEFSAVLNERGFQEQELVENDNSLKCNSTSVPGILARRAVFDDRSQRR
jgi:hypothetical protein